MFVGECTFRFFFFSSINAMRILICQSNLCTRGSIIDPRRIQSRCSRTSGINTYDTCCYAINIKRCGTRRERAIERRKVVTLLENSGKLFLQWTNRRRPGGGFNKSPGRCTILLDFKLTSLLKLKFTLPRARLTFEPRDLIYGFTISVIAVASPAVFRNDSVTRGKSRGICAEWRK